MNNIHFQHGSRLSWQRDFFRIDDATGKLSSVRLNLFQRILRATLGNLAFLGGFDAFYANTIFTQKRITVYETGHKPEVVSNIQILVKSLGKCGKNFAFNPAAVASRGFLCKLVRQ